MVLVPCSRGETPSRPTPPPPLFLNALSDLVSSASSSRVVAVVLKHGATGRISESIYRQFTEDDEKNAVKVGQLLKGILDNKDLPLLSAHSSAYPHVATTCDALLSGAGSALTVTQDPLLGNPSIFVKDAEVAEEVFKEQGHDYCTEALIRGEKLPGWSDDPGTDAKALLTHLFKSIPQQNSVGLFVTHDIVIATLVSCCLGSSLKLADLPRHLDGAVFWREGNDAIEVRYGDHSGKCQWEF